MIGPVIALVLGATIVWRRRLSARLEREWTERHPAGRDGIVDGARPIAVRGTGRRAVLLLHGFGDTPQSLRFIAAHLHDAGMTVHAPLLPGHGRSPREFDAVDAEALIDAARDAWRQLAASHEEVALVGVSMGGALAAVVASEEPRPAALVLIAPYLELGGVARWSVKFHWAWSWSGPFVPSGGGRSIRDAEERERSLAYGIVTARALRTLGAVARAGSAALPRVRTPTLMIQSRRDNRIAAEAAERAFGRIGSANKQFTWADDGHHVLTVDLGRERVQRMAAEWIVTHLGRQPRIVRRDVRD